MISKMHSFVIFENLSIACFSFKFTLNILTNFLSSFSQSLPTKILSIFFSYSLLYIVLINMYTHFNFQVKEKITKKNLFRIRRAAVEYVVTKRKEKKNIYEKKIFFLGESESHTEMNFSKQKKISSVVWIRNELKHFYVLSWLEVYFSHHEFRNLLETWKNSQFYLIANWREKKFF